MNEKLVSNFVWEYWFRAAINFNLEMTCSQEQGALG
ncbi:unnamed protein product [Arabidopsis lyrata]|nr:unnamed protein product [Arabidopsis lyrata]